MKKVIIKGTLCKFLENHEFKTTPLSEVADCPFEYGIRHPDNDWCRPMTIEQAVVVNRLGKLYAPKPLFPSYPKGTFMRVRRVREGKGGTETWDVSLFRG